MSNRERTEIHTDLVAPGAGDVSDPFDETDVSDRFDESDIPLAPEDMRKTKEILPSRRDVAELLASLAATRDALRGVAESVSAAARGRAGQVMVASEDGTIRVHVVLEIKTG